MGTTNGITQTYAQPGDLTGDQYRESWGQEAIHVYVDDKGVSSLNWVSPSEVLETLNDDVVLMEFDQMMDIFKQQVLAKVVYSPYGGTEADASFIVNRQFVIQEIKLGSMVIARKNNPNEYLGVPVWDFFGYEIDTYSPDYINQPEHFQVDENNQRKINNETISFLTINAIDGSIIDRGLGY